MKCVSHDTEECLKCMPPDEYYRWQIQHNLISIFYLPAYWGQHDQANLRHVSDRLSASDSSAAKEDDGMVP